MTWELAAAITVLTLCTWAMRFAGLWAGDRFREALDTPLVALMPLALITALITGQTVAGENPDFALTAAAGVAVALSWWGADIPLVVVVSVVAAAVFRSWGL